MQNWRWLSRAAVVAMHGEQIAEHGGAPGVRDQGLLDSALDRPRNLASYGEPSVFALAAAYAGGILRNHPFIDGNKRAAFLATYVFLRLNGHRLVAPEAEVVAMVLGLASREIDEAGFAAWLERRSSERGEE